MNGFFLLHEREKLNLFPSRAATLVEELKKNKRPVYLYGAGRYSIGLLDIALRWVLHDHRHLIKGFLDNDAEKIYHAGLPVFEPDVPIRLGEKPVIIVSVLPDTMRYFEIIRDCQRKGFEYIASDEFMTLSWKPLPVEELEGNVRAVEALDIWEDDESRDVYRRQMRAWVSKNPEEFHQPAPFKQYFLPSIPRRCYEYFLDCGAYTGDTFRDFREIVNNHFHQYYAVEGDMSLFATLMKTTGNDPRVSCFNVVLGNGKEVRFASYSQTEDEKQIRSCTIDSLLQDKTVTFIKMDIEGHEMAALEGARETISRMRPVMAICMYHLLEHMWNIPLWIKNLGFGYKLYCRHHAYRSLGETVCYALPDS